MDKHASGSLPLGLQLQVQLLLRRIGLVHVVDAQHAVAGQGHKVLAAACMAAGSADFLL